MKHAAGFNMFELLAVMMIVGILAAVAVPSFKYVTVSNRIATEVNGLLGDMQYARNEAVREGRPVTVCASANPTATAPTCSGSTAWQSGWIVFSDPNANQQVDAGEAVLRAQTRFTSDDTFISNNRVEAVTFNREGYAASGPQGAVTPVNHVTIFLHDATDNAAWTRCLAINTASLSKVGMLATEQAGQGACT